MTEMNTEPTLNADKAGPLVPGETTLWKDVAEASASRDAHEWTWEDVEDVLEVRLSDAEKASMLSLNGADEEEKERIEAEIASLKEELKDKKAEVTSIASRMKDRNRTGAKGAQSRKRVWRVGTCFALNTVRYIDPDTGLVVHERPLTRDERQLELAVGDLLDVKPTADPEPASNGDDAAVTDPDALLDAAKKGEEPSPSDVSLDNEPPYYDDSDDEDEEDDEEGDS